MPWPAIRKTANNDNISHLNSRPKLPFPGNGKGNYKMPREGKGNLRLVFKGNGNSRSPLIHSMFDSWIFAIQVHSIEYASSSSWPLIELPTIYNLWLLLLSFLSFDNAFYICRWIITQTFFDVTRNTTVILFIRKWIKPPNLLQVLRFLILIPFILLDFCSIKISRYRYNSTPFAARIFLVLKCKVEHIFLLTGDSQTRGRGSIFWDRP